MAVRFSPNNSPAQVWRNKVGPVGVATSERDLGNSSIGDGPVRFWNRSAEVKLAVNLNVGKVARILRSIAAKGSVSRVEQVGTQGSLCHVDVCGTG